MVSIRVPGASFEAHTGPSPGRPLPLRTLHCRAPFTSAPPHRPRTRVVRSAFPWSSPAVIPTAGLRDRSSRGTPWRNRAEGRRILEAERLVVGVRNGRLGRHRWNGSDWRRNDGRDQRRSQARCLCRRGRADRWRRLIVYRGRRQRLGCLRRCDRRGALRHWLRLDRH